MIDQLKSEFPNFECMQQSELILNDLTLGWQVTAISKNKHILGSGFHKDLEQARKIAVAEFIERNFFRKIKSSKKSKDWDLVDYPTSCGFAVGFDLKNTKLRSICEAIERWSLSQWLDNDCPIEETYQSLLSNSSKALLSSFESYRCFGKSFIYKSDQGLMSLELGLILAFTKNGAFIGSAVRTSAKEAFEHAAIESHRHLIIASQNRNKNIFPENRINFFSKNRSLAEQIISQRKNNYWPELKIRLYKEHTENFYFVVRTIFEGWNSWHLGPDSRMLY